MRTRTLVSVGLIAAVAVGSATPSLAVGKAKSKPKPITMTYTASAYPDPTSTNPATKGVCTPTLPTAIDKHAFTVPAAGTLEVKLGNKLDWSLAVREGADTLATSDGSGSPADPESTIVSFKKKTTISIDSCNNEGEPSIPVTVTFTYK